MNVEDVDTNNTSPDDLHMPSIAPEHSSDTIANVFQYNDIRSLATSNEQDRNRLQLFFELLDRFTKDVTETHLETMKKRHKHIYRDDCTKLYAFNLENETDENHAWVKLHFPMYRKNFPTRNFSKTANTKLLVGNIIRHCIRWLNDNYHFEKPIIFQNIESRWIRQSGETKLTNVNFISF